MPNPLNSAISAVENAIKNHKPGSSAPSSPSERPGEPYGQFNF